MSDTQPEFLEIGPKIVGILSILKNPEIRLKILGIPEIRREIPEILKSGV